MLPSLAGRVAGADRHEFAGELWIVGDQTFGDDRGRLERQLLAHAVRDEDGQLARGSLWIPDRRPPCGGLATAHAAAKTRAPSQAVPK